MARAAQANNCNAMFSRFLKTQFHGFATDYLTEAVVAVRQGKGVVVQNDLHGPAKIQSPCLDPGEIPGYAHHPVAVMACQVGAY